MRGGKKTGVRDWEITDSVLIQLWGWRRLNRKTRHSSFSFLNTLSDSDKKKYVQTLPTTHASPRLQKQLRLLRFIAAWHLSGSRWWMELQVTGSLAAAQPCFSSHKCFHPAQLWCHSEISMSNRDDRSEPCSVSNSNRSSCFYNFWQRLPCLRFFQWLRKKRNKYFIAEIWPTRLSSAD